MMRSTFILVVTVFLFLACTATAQEVPLTPEMQEWEPFVGKWLSEIEIGENPNAEWQKLVGTMEVRSEGYFLEVHRAFKFGEEELSSLEIIGFDPLKRTYIATSFTSAGGHAAVSSMDWNGTTLTVNFTAVTAEREVEVRRAIWELSSDSKSLSLTVEGFTDGQWWIRAKGRGTKVE